MGRTLVTGIDIGRYSIKAVVLKPVKDTFALVGYHEIPIEADIFSDNHLLNYQKIVKKLKELRKGLPLFSRKAALCVPDNAVISKVLQIDSELSGSEREFAIFQAFSHQSPFPVEELNLDFVAIDPQAQRHATASYQVFATRKELVDSRVDATSKAGFEPVLLDVQAYGLTQIWHEAARIQQRKNWLLLDVGFTQASVCIDVWDKPPLCKEFPVGTQSVINHPSESLESGEQRLVREVMDKLQRHIQLVSSMSNREIEGVWLTGGAACDPQLQVLLQDAVVNRLQLKFESLDPLALFQGASKVQGASKGNKKPGFAFATAAGLALRGLQWMENRHAA